MDSLEILRQLVAFPTVSRDSNLALIDYVRALSTARGLRCDLIRDASGRKANLLVSTGPAGVPGIVLSGHTDVVPVDGQNWTVPPFQLTEREGLLYGRGTADMKGFVASAIMTILNAAEINLARPLHVALSHDEEIGCVGVRTLLDHMQGIDVRPMFCLVGEPTGMTVTTGHKGKIAVRITCRGREGHSAMAPRALNAIHLACDMIAALRNEQKRLEAEGVRDDAYEIPYSTVHAGTIAGGTALNIVPNLCTLDFEVRFPAAEDPSAIIRNIADAARSVEQEARQIAGEASIEIEIVNSYPGLDTPVDAEAVELIRSVVSSKTTQKVAFGTEGGLFTEKLNIPTVICGPGFMAQGHKPDEYISVEQMKACDAMLGKLVDFARRPIA